MFQDDLEVDISHLGRLDDIRLKRIRLGINNFLEMQRDQNIMSYYGFGFTPYDRLNFELCDKCLILHTSWKDLTTRPECWTVKENPKICDFCNVCFSGDANHVLIIKPWHQWYIGVSHIKILYTVFLICI